MRFSSPISCITPLDARQESLPTSRRGEEDHERESCIRKATTPRTKAETKSCPRCGSSYSAHGSRKAARDTQELLEATQSSRLRNSDRAVRT